MTGHSVCRFLPRLDRACFEVFWHAWRQAFPAKPMAVVLDNRGAHTSRRVTWPDGMEPLPLPAYSQELNPGERWFKEWRTPLSNQVHDHLEALEAWLTQALRPYWQQPSRLVQRTAYPWWQDGVQHIMTLSQ